MHYAQLGLTIKRIFSDLSILPAKTIARLYDELLTKGTMGRKVLSINGYQKAYLGVHYQVGFDETQRANFNPIPLKDNYVKTPEFLLAESGLSPYYNRESVLAKIRENYSGYLSNTHASLAHWRRNPNFPLIINNLRKKGWRDWQILAAMADFLLHEKATQIAPPANFNSQDDWRAAFKTAYAELKSTDEKDSYMEVPAEELAGPHFEPYLNKVPADILEVYGLQKNMDFPNFTAFRAILDARFAFYSDDVKELSPFNF
ncbi:hypothetical protein ABID99_004920 [Mucilaginibacter sp. OAE612]|uniref:hypothetical protein n=1 Tax=Mucilaginibacter sp. OAE612 TaxID=3156444 RepID=UPI00359DC42B